MQLILSPEFWVRRLFYSVAMVPGLGNARTSLVASRWPGFALGLIFLEGYLQLPSQRNHLPA